MRPYATFSPLFWTGDTGKKLRKHGDIQRAAAYLMTSPHSHQSGVYWLPMMYLSNEVGLSMEGASEALIWLTEEGFARYDEKREWVWVCEMAAWQIGTELSPTDKRCKGLQQYLTTLPDLPFIPDFIERYAADFHLRPPIPRGLQGAPGGAPSEQIRSGTEKEQDQIRPGDSPPRKTSEPKKRASKRCPTDFAVTDDLREWARAKCPGVDLDRETAKFMDHEYKDPKSDWPAAWRTWMSKALDFQPANGSRGVQPVHRPREFGR
jgi:hypothetical protein